MVPTRRASAVVVTAARHPRIYDHRIKEQILRSRNPNLLPELHIPASTATSWIQRGLGEVVSLHADGAGEDVLREQIATIESPAVVTRPPPVPGPLGSRPGNVRQLIALAVARGDVLILRRPASAADQRSVPS